MSTFQAGLGIVDITPDPGLLLWGYADRTGPAKRTLDPLHCKALVFRAKGKTAAWVVLDLGRPPMPPECQAVRIQAHKQGIDHVAFHATHTHHAPAVEVLGEHRRAWLVERIVESLALALDDLRDARVGIGACEIDIAHNRREILPDGGCRMRWRNEDRTPTEPLDKEATIIRIESAEGAPIAALVHYACHPVVMGPTNLEYSADYVGELCRKVTLDAGFECVFLQGGCGDINPYLDKTPMSEGGGESMLQTGRESARPVVDALKTMGTLEPESAMVGLTETMVDVGVRWNLDDPEQCRLIADANGLLFDHYMSGLGHTLSVPVTTLLLNRELALVGMPGEFFVHYQLELKRRAPVPYALICGYVNDFQAYFPPVSDAAAGGYGGSVATYAGLGAADKLFTRAEIDLYRLLGKFHKPSAGDFEILE